VMIAREGKPVELLIGVEDAEALWAELLWRDPQFPAAIAESRQSLQRGEGISIEEMKATYSHL
jgi:hypothetical protein